MARSSSADPLEKFRFFVIETSTALGKELTQTIVNADKVPIKNIFKYTVPTDLASAGFVSVQMPKMNTNKITYREGDDPEISSLHPGISSTEDIVLTKGIVAGGGSNFYEWAQAIITTSSTDNIFDYAGSKTTQWQQNDNFRKDLQIIMLNRDGSIARRWAIYNAFPVNFIPGSDLNATEDGEKSMESLSLTYESFKELPLTEEENIPLPQPETET